MALGKKQIRELYRNRAATYDLSANLYYLAGFREQAYRKMAVRELQLRPGDTVVDVGCGTGLNFVLLQKALGKKGRIIGVDITPEMLGRARERVEKNRWSNVELVHSDAARYEFPDGVNGVLSTFAITLVPEYDRVIENGAEALAAGGRFVVLDLKKPEKRPIWLVRLGVFLTRPFGVSLDMADRHPWESIRRYLNEIAFRDLYAGFAYLSTGQKGEPR